MTISATVKFAFLALVVWSCSAQAETLKVLVVLVEWSSPNLRTLPSRDDIHQLWNGPGNSALVPGESVADWMKSNSYGKYQIQADVTDWYKVTETEIQASFGNTGHAVTGNENLLDILLPALVHAGDTYDLKDYADENNHLIGIVFVHSGYAAEQGGRDADGTDYHNRIASKAWTANMGLQDGTRVKTFATVSAFKGVTGNKMAGIGYHIHEWLHAKFGLHDLNDTGGRCKYLCCRGVSRTLSHFVVVIAAVVAIILVAGKAHRCHLLCRILSWHSSFLSPPVSLQTTTAPFRRVALAPLESCPFPKDKATTKPFRAFSTRTTK